MANTHSIDLEASSSQYLSITDGSLTGLDVTGNYTIETWFKAETLPTAGDQFKVLVGKGYVPGNNGYYLRFFYNGGTQSVQFGHVASYVSWEYSTNIVTGTWYHLSGVYNGATMKIYLDGVEKASADVTTDPISGTQPFVIGGNKINASVIRYFDGKIDEVRVWSDARTQTEIEDNMSLELNGDETNLEGYWKLNNDLLDETSNDNDLTNNNTATFSTDIPFSVSGPANLKSINGLAKASIKSRNGLAIGSIKSINGLS